MLASCSYNRCTGCHSVMMQDEQIQQDFGGSVWESNPPFDSLGAESPALKAGTVTGPFSPPQCNHIISKLSIEAARRTFSRLAAALQECYS